MYAVILDISEHKGIIDFDIMEQAYKAGLFHAVYVRATCAGSKSVFEDETFKTNWAALKARSIPRGAYMYYSPQYNPKEQAARFVMAITGIKNISVPWSYTYFDRKLKSFWETNNDFGELPPMVDFETYWEFEPVRDAIKLRDHVKETILQVETMTRCVPGLYTSPGFWKPIEPVLSASLGYYPLWMAWYPYDQLPNVDYLKSRVPYPWWSEEFDAPGQGGWTFWQYTKNADGVSYGIEKWSSSLDMSIFNGSPEEFTDWLRGYGIPEAIEHAAPPYTGGTGGGVPAETDLLDPVGTCASFSGKPFKLLTNLKIRTQPTVSNDTHRGTFLTGATVDVTGEPVESGGYVWLPVFSRYYMAYSTLDGSKKYMEEIA